MQAEIARGLCEASIHLGVNILYQSVSILVGSIDVLAASQGEEWKPVDIA